MNSRDIIAHRLLRHQIAETSFTQPEEIVSYYGAMQAQDWSMAKWALGLRLPHLKEKEVEAKFNSGKILRTHILRPTWHFVAPKDLCWIQKLTAPRVHQANKMYYTKHDITPKLISKTEPIIAKALAGKNYLTREELNAHLAKNKITAYSIQLTYILMNAELECLICSGPRQGKQFTHALVEERVPATKALSRNEALKKLTNIYFTTRGPATAYDYSWWSGLTLKDVREGIEMLDSGFERETLDGKEYMFKPMALPDLKGKQTTFLIPDYDEYGISYKDRSAYHHPKWKETEAMINADYYHAIAVDGYFGGTWSKKMIKNKVIAEVQPFQSLTASQIKKVEKAVKMYDQFFKNS